MRNIFFLITLASLVFSCNKQADVTGGPYDGQDTLYCNDPEAINYNYDFPGTADNSICLFPADVFRGNYFLTDTIYTQDFASFYVVNDTLTVYQLTKTNMAVVGFCGPLDSIKLTAGRYYKATIDSTILNGQPLCNLKDTISGVFSSNSIGLRVNFTLVSDTAGIKFHRGTAVRIQ